MWAQVEWWLDHRHGWLVKRQWAGSVLGRVTCNEYQVLGSSSIPARLDTLVYWEPFSWLTSVTACGILHAGVGLIGRPAVISGRYNKCPHYSYRTTTHAFRHCNTHMHASTTMRNWSWERKDHRFQGIVCWPWQKKSCVIG